MSRYYDAIAVGYQGLYGEEQEKKMTIIRQHLVITKQMVCLDVGCGSGISSNLPCKVIGIDPSFTLLKQFIPGRNQFRVQAEAEHLPFGNCIFDVVLCISAIHNFSDIPCALLEMERVGKGHTVITLLKKARTYDFIRSLILERFLLSAAADEEKDTLFFLRKKEDHNSPCQKPAAKNLL